MIRFIFILLLFPFVSCGQTYSKFNFQNSIIINQQEDICLNENNCFCFKSDSSVSYLKMYYFESGGHKMLIDSVEFSPYKSKIHSFESLKGNASVILWETEYEYSPVIIAYYVALGKLIRIGSLEISLPCKSCESIEFPIKDIQIFQKGDEVEISFLKDVNYKEKDSQQWKEYEQGNLKFYFNILNKEFKVNTNQ